jgi:hypothetical protein
MSIGVGALLHKPPRKEQAAPDGGASCAFAVGHVRGDAENPAAGAGAAGFRADWPPRKRTAQN